MYTFTLRRTAGLPQVYRSSTDVAITAYEPKVCELLRVAIPFRGPQGVLAWIEWEVDVGTRKRRKELLRRLNEVQKVHIL